MKGEKEMWSKKSKGFKDERIVKESNKLSAKMFYVITVATILLLVVKIACKLPAYVYLVEMFALAASLLYVLAAELKKGILFVKNKDEELQSIHEAVLTTGMMTSFWIVIIGEFLFLFFAGEYFLWTLSYFAIWLIPALIITIASIKNGWIIWGGKKRETEGKKNLKVRVAIGSLVYGIIVGGSFVYKDGEFHPEGILWVLGLAAFWGILFYGGMSLIMKASENKADKKLEEKEKEDEE